MFCVFSLSLSFRAVKKKKELVVCRSYPKSSLFFLGFFLLVSFPEFLKSFSRVFFFFFSKLFS